MSVSVNKISDVSAARRNEPVVMGIINVNNNSFFADSRCADISSFANQFEQMSQQGAGIIDIGACSTRPGSTPVSLEQEWEYLKEPLMHIRKIRELGRIQQNLSIKQNSFIQQDSSMDELGKISQGESGANPQILSVMVPQISIDTFRSEIVRRAYDIIGEFIVNDISAGEDDPYMLKTVGELGLEYIAMHKRGTPDTMQQMCDYPSGVVKEVAEYFISFAERAAEYGIKNYVVDPGFGFAKTVEQNYELFMGMPQLMSIVKNSLSCNSSQHRLLVGISRKSMIYKPLGITPEDSLTATAALNLQALLLGADILRVHDVKEAVQCVKLYKMLGK